MNVSLYKKLKINKLLVAISFMLFGVVSFAQSGNELFKQNCASCHHPLKDGTGPALQGAKQRWADAGGDIYAWVHNPDASIAAGDPRALAVKDYSPTNMTAFGALSNEDIDAILEYVDGVTPPPPSTGDSASSGTSVAQNQGTSWVWWLVITVVLLMIIVALWGVRKQLTYAVKEKEGEEVEEETTGQEIKGWMWKNLKLVSVLGFVLFCALIYWLSSLLYQVGVFENYVPEQPIAFTHKVHAGDHEIDCEYCHNSASKSKTAGIPTVNVCMNCHKDIVEATSGAAGTAEIAKIHKAAGYDTDTRMYTGKTEPIKWIKAHNLPDHVYFNHSQHVEVGKIACENCHGPVSTFTLGRTTSTEAVNEMAKTGEGLRKGVNKGDIIQLENQILTMGWCIECHGKANVKDAGSKYYDEIHERLKSDKELYKQVMEDGKLTVKELGGWECAKCHY